MLLLSRLIQCSLIELGLLSKSHAAIILGLSVHWLHTFQCYQHQELGRRRHHPFSLHQYRHYIRSYIWNESQHPAYSSLSSRSLIPRLIITIVLSSTSS